MGTNNKNKSKNNKVKKKTQAIMISQNEATPYFP